MIFVKFFQQPVKPRSRFKHLMKQDLKFACLAKLAVLAVAGNLADTMKTSVARKLNKQYLRMNFPHWMKITMV